MKLLSMLSTAALAATMSSHVAASPAHSGSSLLEPRQETPESSTHARLEKRQASISQFPIRLYHKRPVALTTAELDSRLTTTDLLVVNERTQTRSHMSHIPYYLDYERAENEQRRSVEPHYRLTFNEASDMGRVLVSSGRAVASLTCWLLTAVGPDEASVDAENSVYIYDRQAWYTKSDSFGSDEIRRTDRPYDGVYCVPRPSPGQFSAQPVEVAA